ncbi:hypothetical protein E4U14_002290 [Claviceps sp. LM454 group G7]|nr:hypothetical protein E4U14_002290 [Claviceps sp. LM454 group G7]
MSVRSIQSAQPGLPRPIASPQHGRLPNEIHGSEIEWADQSRDFTSDHSPQNLETKIHFGLSNHWPGLELGVFRLARHGREEKASRDERREDRRERRESATLDATPGSLK